MNKLQILPEETLSLQVQEPIVRTGAPVIHPKRITENGQYSAKAEGASGFDPVEVAVDLKPAFDTGYTTGYKIGAKEGAEVGYAKGEQEGYTKGYDKGTHDGEQNALDAFNRNLQGIGIEHAESVEQINEKFEEATQQQYDSGIEIGKVEGKQAQYDAFWDAYLQKGSIRETSMLFAGKGWNDTTFQPKYSIHAENPYMLFRQSSITDIGQTLKERNVVMTLKGPILQYTFNGMASKTLDNIVFAEPITTMYTAFGSATNLEHIECPIPVQDANISGDSFSWCAALKEIRFTGTINSNLSFDKSNLLSAQSVQSILDALKDRTGTTSLTLTLHKDVGAKLTQAQKDAISAKNWTLAY